MRLCAFCSIVFLLEPRLITVFCISVCILGLGHLYRFLVFCVCCDFHFGSMPYGKGNQGNKRNPKEDTNREENLEYEAEITARDREDTLSPLSPASSSSAGSGESDHSGASLSSTQLEMILAANSRLLADSMASSHKSMEASMLSILSTLAPASAGSVASTPAVASRPSVKVPKWSDGDQPFTFFTKLETALTHNRVDKATWGSLLPVYLSGRAEAAFSQVDSTLLGNYDSVKSVLLKALGDTPAHADRNWWNLARLSGETPADFYLRIRNTGLRRFCELPSREAVVEHVILSRFLSLLHADSYSAVMSQRPKTGLEAAELLQDFEETRAHSWKRQSWKHSQSGRREHGSSSGSGSGSNSGRPSSRENSPPVGDGSSKTNVVGSENPRNFGSDRPSRKPIICHGCGEPGHIRPQCPNRERVWSVNCVRSTETPVSDPNFLANGFLAGIPCSDLSIDTGAEKSVVNAKCVPKSAYLGRSITLGDGRGGQNSKHQLARLKITVGEVSVVAEVAVAEQLHCSALLGRDLGREMVLKLASMVVENMQEVKVEVPMQKVKVEVPMQKVKVEVPMQVVKVEVPMEEVKVEVPVEFEPEDASDAPAVAFEIEPEDASEAPAVAFEIEPEDASEAPAVAFEIEPEDASEAPAVAFEIEPEDASEAPAVAFEFESEDASEAPTVAFEDIFPFSDSLFEPEDAGDAPTVVMNDIFSLSVFPFGPDLGEVEFSLPEMTDVSDQVFEVLEAGVASVHCDSFVVPRQEEVKVLEVLEAGVASVKCDTFVVPRQNEVKVLEILEAGVASVICDKIVVPMQQFFVNDQADVGAFGPVDDKPMVGLDVLNLMDGFSETDLVLVSVPVARPEPDKVVNVFILIAEDRIPPKLRWQSPTVWVDHCLRRYSKAAGKIAPSAFISVFDIYTLVIYAVCSFCSCISVSVSKFLVVLFFGAFGTRVMPFLLWLDDLRCRMPEAPATLISLYPCLRQTKGGEMLWSPSHELMNSLTLLACQPFALINL